MSKHAAAVVQALGIAPTVPVSLLLAALTVSLTLPVLARAEGPQNRVEAIGQEQLVVRRIEIVGDNGAIGDRILPGIGDARRIALDIAADGTPSITLADAQSRPRIRLRVTEDGYGAIEFLDAHGSVIEVIAPEAGGSRN